MRTRGGGVQKPENFADVLNGWPLILLRAGKEAGGREAAPSPIHPAPFPITTNKDYSPSAFLRLSMTLPDSLGAQPEQTDERKPQTVWRSTDHKSLGRSKQDPRESFTCGDYNEARLRLDDLVFYTSGDITLRQRRCNLVTKVPVDAT